MTNVFISYSRRDKIFTQKLYEALKASGREIWADWDSIPVASDWSAEIKEGIEKTEVVLFVLSPEWLKSNECRKEYDHAVSMGKKLIPILYQMVDPNEAPSELAKINWVYMRDADDFEKAFHTLAEAMDTDLGWVKTHTRLQVRALEWDKKNRDSSLVLRGNDLVAGEQFISQGTHNNPVPTVLHGEYVVASRKDATRRQRMTLAGVTFALVVSTALGVIAFFQRQAAVAARAEAEKERDRAVSAESTAIAERDRADLNANVANSRELAALSLNSLSSDPELGILLGLHSVKITEDIGQPVQFASEDALRRAVQVSRVRESMKGHSGLVLSVAISPDAKFIASAGVDKTVRVWNVSGELVLTLSDFSNDVESIAFSPDGSRLLAVSGNTASAWDAKTGEKLVVFSGHEVRVIEAFFSPDGKTVATASSDKSAKVWNAGTGAEVLTLVGHEEELSGIAFSPDGRRIATIDFGGTAIVWDAATGNSLLRLSNPDNISFFDVAYSPDGKYLLFGDGFFQTILLDANSGREVSRQTLHTDFVSSTAFSPDGGLIASASLDNSVIVTDVPSNSFVFRLDDTSDVQTVAYSPDGTFIVTGNKHGDVKLWEANPVNGYEVNGFRTDSRRIDGMAFSPDNEHYVIAGGDAFILSMTDQSSIELVGHRGYILDVAYSSDGKKIITGSFDGTAIIWDSQTGEAVTTLSKDGLWVTTVNFSPDGKLAAGGLEDNTIVIWDAVSGNELQVLRSNFSNSNNPDWIFTEVIFSPDGKTIAGANETTITVLWDVATGNELGVLQGHIDWVRGVSYSPDGKHIATSSYDTTAIIWDSETGKPVLTLRGHAQGITDIAYSPDGSLIATSSVDKSAKLWDANTGELLTTLLTPSDQLLSVAFSPDGKILATGSESGVVRFFYVKIEDLVSLAKTRITRTFTAEECLSYLHKDSCPMNIPQP